jgi:ATP synthase protein I
MKLNHHKWLNSIQRDNQRLNQQENSNTGWIGVLMYGGTLGLLFITPLVAGAYLGRWLDTLLSGYSVRWTISMILLGISVGAYNVFRFMQRH